MIVERKTLSKSAQRAERQRSQVLQFLEHASNPAGETTGVVGKEQALALSNLYLQMADPSVEFLEAVSAKLVSIPFANLKHLQYATLNAGDNPMRFFGRHGVSLDNPDKLREGVSHSGSLIDTVARKFDSMTGELYWGETLDPKALAEATHESIQIRKDERRIDATGEQVKAEPDLGKRYRKGLKLRRQVLDHINGFPFTLYRRYDREKPIEPTWKNLSSYSGLSAELETKDGNTSVGSFGLGEAIDIAHGALTRFAFEKRLARLPSKDQERFDQLRLQYGAKAANLMILADMVPDINQVRKGALGAEIAVPEFKPIPVDSYRAWRAGKIIDDDIKPHFEWASNLKDKDNWWDTEEWSADYMVRSSAVFSEDGVNVTGAGIYDSVRVRGGSTFEDFKAAIAQVYESTDSPKAQAYRAEHGIDQEEMGIVVQRFVTSRDFNMYAKGKEGYINSRMAGVPDLMEVVTETSRNFINRKELDFYLAIDPHMHESAFRNVHHFPPDQFKVDPDAPIRVAQLASVLERIWGRPVQAEFVIDSSTINVVQVRELPDKMLEPAVKVQFPDEVPIYTGSAVGVGDLNLPMLDSQDDNSDQVGAVVFRGNYGWTMEDNNFHLPKAGAVVIYGSDGSNGHIQTLCAEKGLVCIFPQKGDDSDLGLRYSDLLNLRSVRIVSNGIEARLYQALLKD